MNTELTHFSITVGSSAVHTQDWTVPDVSTW
jgi:hypothetical protein